MQKLLKYIFPPLYGLVVYFTIRLLLDTVTGMKFWHRSLGLNMVEMSVCAVMGYVSIRVYQRLFRYFDKHWTTGFSYKRIARELLYIFLANLVLVNLFATPMAALTDDGLQWYDVADINTIPLLYAIIYYGIARSNTFLRAYVANKIQLEKIMNDKLQTELKFLKAQYHPHFLFNALNTIYFQMDENTAAAKKSVEKFSELLRYQLYDQQQKVNISQEMEYLKNFIELQKVRASEKLLVDLQLDEKLNGQQVYPLLFLPLVENAFKYVGGDYRIDIKALVDGNNIDFAVSNSVPKELMASKPNGIGLENLRRRLDLLYPGKHELKIEKSEKEFIASIKLQLNPDER